MRDLANNTKVLIALTPDVLTASKADMTGVDTKGFDVGMLVVHAGTVDIADADETYVITVFESDALGSGYVTTGIAITVVAGDTIQKVAIPNLNTTRKRYLQAQIVIAGTTPSFEGSAEFILGGAASAPVS